MSLLPRSASVTIANGASLSGGIFLGAGVLCAIQMPAVWTTADITFQVSDDGVTWVELMDDTGTAIAVTAPAATFRLALAAGLFTSVSWIKVRSGTSALAVNQAAARTIVIITRIIFPGG